jgi:stringent starvation protein B
MAKQPPPSSRRPYLLRAMHEWMTDNGQTPHLVVDAAIEGVVVPRQYVRDGKIVLNASYTATAVLKISNDGVAFSARFNGAPFDVNLPMQAILGIYARETGEGMIFSDDDPAPNPPATNPSGKAGGDEPRRPQLKVVK